MLTVQTRWIVLIVAAGALAFHSWNSFADQEPAAAAAAAAPPLETQDAATTENEHGQNAPAQTSVPFDPDETLYAGDDIITLVDTPLLSDDDKEIATLGMGTTLIVLQVHGQWVQVDFQHSENPLTGWIDRKHLSLISADYVGVAHESIQDVPKRLAALHASSEEHLSRSDFLASLQASSEVLKLDPDSALTFVRRGHCWYMLGDDEKAIADFTRAIELEPKYEQAYLGRGDALFSSGQYDHAIADYDTVVKANPKAEGAHYMLGRCSYAKGEYDQAVADYDAALALHPNDTWSIAHRADALYAKKDFDAAIAGFDKATQIDREFDWAVARRGDVWLYGKENLDRAIVDYTLAHLLNPHNSWAIHQRGHCLEKKKDFAQAVQDYSHAVQIDPEYWDFSANLAWILSTCHDDTVRDGNSAVELATHACQLSEWTNSFALGTLAAANAETGHFGKAVEYQKKAIELASEGYDIGFAKTLLEQYRSNRPFHEEF